MMKEFAKYALSLLTWVSPRQPHMYDLFVNAFVSRVAVSVMNLSTIVVVAPVQGKGFV